MLSPKDAFRQVDKARRGFIDFIQFASLVRRLCELSGDSLPPFSVIKDLFDAIDIRKDGVIDLREWMNSFNLPDKNFEDTGVYKKVS